MSISTPSFVTCELPPVQRTGWVWGLGDRLATIAELGDDDLHLVVSFIDALVTKNRLRTLAGGLN